MNTCTVLIVAAGRGSRFGSELPKQYCPLRGDTVIGLTLKAFIGHPDINAIRVVIHPDDLELYKKTIDQISSFGFALGDTAILEPVFGGASRQESVSIGLESLSETAPDLVLIHDAARPFVSARVIDRVLNALQYQSAVIPALAVNDTLKRRHERTVSETVDRSQLVRAQTPQGFRFSEIQRAHRHAQELSPGAEMTDDAAIAEYAGLMVNIVDGSEDNVKITSQQDLQMAERALATKDFMTSKDYETRTGAGFDVHRFENGDSVTLCGVSIPHIASLAGHSDADVGLHALTDALLGAIGEGDIGFYFPPNDPKWRGVASGVFVKKAYDLIAEQGGRIVNVDITLICEHPKIGPHCAIMKETIANLLQIPPTRISVKATTTEQLGFTGRNEGIAAQAIASVEIPKD